MGVDFYSCEFCSYVFSDCGEFVSCECGGRFCSNDCAKMDYSVYDEDGNEVDGEDSDGTCIYCRDEEVRDYELIEWCLGQLNLTRAQATKKLVKERPPEEDDDDDDDEDEDEDN